MQTHVERAHNHIEKEIERGERERGESKRKGARASCFCVAAAVAYCTTGRMCNFSFFLLSSANKIFPLRVGFTLHSTLTRALQLC